MLAYSFGFMVSLVIGNTYAYIVCTAPHTITGAVPILIEERPIILRELANGYFRVRHMQYLMFFWYYLNADIGLCDRGLDCQRAVLVSHCARVHCHHLPHGHSVTWRQWLLHVLDDTGLRAVRVTCMRKMRACECLQIHCGGHDDDHCCHLSALSWWPHPGKRCLRLTQLASWLLHPALAHTKVCAVIISSCSLMTTTSATGSGLTALGCRRMPLRSSCTTSFTAGPPKCSRSVKNRTNYIIASKQLIASYFGAGVRYGQRGHHSGLDHLCHHGYRVPRHPDRRAGAASALLPVDIKHK